MPNWCEQDLYILGPKSAREKFIDAITVRDEDTGGEGPEYSILETLYPIPFEIKDTVSPLSVVATDEEAAQKNKEFNESREDGERGSTRYISDAQKAKRLEMYGAVDWYDWCNHNWGTKWGDCNTTLIKHGQNSTKFTLESAWGPITKGLAEVSKSWPKLTFRLHYYEQGMGFSGFDEIAKGTVNQISIHNNYRGGRGG